MKYPSVNPVFAQSAMNRDRADTADDKHQWDAEKKEIKVKIAPLQNIRPQQDLNDSENKGDRQEKWKADQADPVEEPEHAESLSA
ncbi:MAG: hypothetical protein ACPHP7_08875 [Planctomycetota bacterium]